MGERAFTSSFDQSVPIPRRFIACVNGENSVFGILCHKGDAPLTEERLVEHGYTLETLKRAFRELLAIVCHCRPMDINATYDSSDVTGSIYWKYEHIDRSVKLRRVYLHITPQRIGVLLDLPKNKKRGKVQPGFEWPAFIDSSIRLLTLLYRGEGDFKFAPPEEYIKILEEDDFELRGSYPGGVFRGD